MNEEKKKEWSKFPGTLEASSFRKTSAEFVFSIATAQAHEEYATAMMSHLSRSGVFFFVPCSADQIEALLRESHSGPASQVGNGAPNCELLTPNCFVDVTTMAALFGVTERTVQLDAEKGELVRTARGQYDTLASCGTLRKALRDAEGAISEDYKKEKGLILREQRIKLTALNMERLGRLMNAEKTRQAIEHLEAEERQALLNMPKTMGPQCDMLPGREVELKLMEWVRRYLKEQSAWERIVSLVRAALSGQSMNEQKEKSKKKRKAKAA